MPSCERQMRARSRGERSVRLLWRGLVGRDTRLLFQGAFDGDREPVGQGPAVGIGGLPRTLQEFFVKAEMRPRLWHVTSLLGQG